VARVTRHIWKQRRKVKRERGGAAVIAGFSAMHGAWHAGLTDMQACNTEGMKFPKPCPFGLRMGYSALILHCFRGEESPMRSFVKMNCGALIRSLLAVLALGIVAVPGSAHAWWHGGWGWHGGCCGFVVGVVPPPVVIGPPVVVAPPPVVYAPPPTFFAPAPPPGAFASAPSCYAGSFVCPLEVASPAGAPCNCPTNTGRIAGQVH
jgi:hypothetical protein